MGTSCTTATVAAISALGNGTGGIDRGPGEAPMFLGDEKYAPGSRMQKGRIENKFLSPGDVVEKGVRVLEPKPDPGRFSPGTVRNFGAQTGTEVSRTRVSPAQKDVVKKYFGE